MDDKWFKQQQKIAGVTAEDIAKRLGRDRSVVSRIYVGRQKMTLDQAQAFSDVLKVPLDEVLVRAGALSQDDEPAQQVDPLAGDVVRWTPIGQGIRKVEAAAQALGASQNGTDIWRMNSNAMSLQGIVKNDFLLVDTLQAERARAGDIVLAKVFSGSRGRSELLIRRYEPPVLVSASAEPNGSRVHIVDGINAIIQGKVVSSWRYFSAPEP